MFRFVDVLPYLNSSDEVARHLKEYFSSQGQEMSSVLGWGLGLSSFAPGLLASAVTKNVTQMAKMFGFVGKMGTRGFDALKSLRQEFANSRWKKLSEQQRTPEMAKAKEKALKHSSRMLAFFKKRLLARSCVVLRPAGGRPSQVRG